jgi:hypothetical protein
MHTIATPGRRRPDRRALAVAAFAALVLAGCGSSGGSDAKEAPAKPKATTTTAAEKVTTTTEAEKDDQSDVPEGLPTDEADAPEGDWISVRFLVATEPEPEGFNKGSAEARLWNVEPDCPGDDEPCSLDISGGGDGGSFSLPGTEPIEGESITLEPDGDEWSDTYEYPDDVGCTDELDGPYIHTVEERTMQPVYDEDGALTGAVGTVLFTDSLTQEGRDAGCPASSEATHAYALVAAPNDGIGEIDQYTVDGTFKQTLEVTAAENQTLPRFQEGGLSTTLQGYDPVLEGSCEDGECSVEFTAVAGDGDVRRDELTSDDGQVLQGGYESLGSCFDDDGKKVAADAYETSGTYEDLTPIWVENGEVKAFVGKYTQVAEPTAEAKSNPDCSKTETLEAWVYLVDADVLG